MKKLLFLLFVVAGFTFWLARSLGGFDDQLAHSEPSGDPQVSEEVPPREKVGRLSAVDDDWNFVVIDHYDEGKMKADLVCEVVRQEKVVGKVMITTSEFKRSVADLLTVQGPVYPGDEVRLVTSESK